jgi:hypothetical protein
MMAVGFARAHNPQGASAKKKAAYSAAFSYFVKKTGY